MVEDAGNELARQGREVVLASSVVEAVHALVLIPAREVEVAAVARLVTPRLGREGGVAAVLQCDAAHRLSIEYVVGGRLQGGSVMDRELLLAPAELGVVLLDGKPLRLERRDDFVDDR